MRSFKLLKNIILSVMMLALPMGLLAQSNLKQIPVSYTHLTLPTTVFV